MALPPPAHVPRSEPVDPDAAHKASVAELERCLDAALAGKLQGMAPGEPVQILMPLGPLNAKVRDDIKAHYLAAGWANAEIDDGAPPHVLTLTP